MSEQLQVVISNISPIVVAILAVLIVVVLYRLPKAIKEIGIKKIGPIQLEQQNLTLNHITATRIEEVDIENKENLWEMTEEFSAKIALQSKVSCSSAVAAVLAAVITPLQTMILLNHIAPKLVKEQEAELLAKLNRSIFKSYREFSVLGLPQTCPAQESLSEISPENSCSFFPEWITLARDITARACFKKIKIYEEAIEGSRSEHWRNIFKKCLEKNTAYMEGMGWTISKLGLPERM